MKKLVSLILCLTMVCTVYTVCAVTVSAEETDLAETGFAPVNLGDDFYAYIGMTNGSGRWLTNDVSVGDIVASPSVNNPTQTWRFVRSGSCYKIYDVIDYFNLIPAGSIFNDADVITSPYTDNNLWTIEQDGGYYLIHPATDQSFFLYEDTGSPEHRIRFHSDASLKGDGRVYITKVDITDAMKAAPSVTIANAVTGVNLKWTANAAVDTFRVRRYNPATEAWDTVMTTSGHTYTDTNVKSGVTYKYSVQGTNPVYSAEAIKSLQYLSVPKLTGVDNTTAGPVIKWKAVPGAVKYRVFYNEGGWKALGDTTGTSFTHSEFSYNKAYTYTVRCVTSNGKKFASAFDTTGITNTIVKNPAVKATLKPNGYYLGWSKVSGAKKYRVFINCKSTGWKWVKVTDVTTNNYFFSNTMKVAKFRMKHGEQFLFTVRCMDSAGKIISGFTSTAKLLYYDAPKITSIDQGNPNNTIRWKAIKGAVKYRVFSWNGKKWINKGTTTGTVFKTPNIGAAKQNKTYAVRALNKSGKYITSYWETYDSGGNVYYYSPGVWTSKNKF